jgi:flagellar FliJ protein
MRRFQFRLETVLDVRRVREREARREVAARRLELSRVERLNHETRAAIGEQQDLLRGVQQSGAVEPAVLAQRRAWIAHLRQGLLQREALRRELQSRVAAALERLRLARQQTRTIEKLRERRHAEHRRAAQRHEQRISDELARQLPTFDEAAPDAALLNRT